MIAACLIVNSARVVDRIVRCCRAILPLTSACRLILDDQARGAMTTRNSSTKLFFFSFVHLMLTHTCASVFDAVKLEDCAPGLIQSLGLISGAS